MPDEITYGQDQQIRIDIMKDIHAGRSPFSILSRAVEYIAKKSGEPTFAKVVKENIRSIYGIGLDEPELLQEELSEVIARNEKLQTAYNKESSEEHKKRIEYAIWAHKKRIEELQNHLRIGSKA